MATATGFVVLAAADSTGVAADVAPRIAVLALLVLGAALVLGWSSLVLASLILFVGTYATHLAGDNVPLDAKAPFLAAGLLVVAELAYWSLEERADVRGVPGDGLRRLGFVAFMALSALVVGAALVAVAEAVRVESLALDLFGAAAAVAMLLVVVLGQSRTDR